MELVKLFFFSCCFFFCFSAFSQIDWKEEPSGDETMIHARLHEQIEVANELLNQNQIDRALILLLGVLEQEDKLPPDSDTRIRLNNNFSRALGKSGAPGMAATYAKKAFYIIQNHHPESKDGLVLQCGMIGTHFLRAGEMDSAAVFFALGLKKAQDFKFYLRESAAYNNLGILYSESGEISLARENYMLALKVLKNEGDNWNSRSLRYSINDNMAILYEKEGNYSKALELYEMNVALAEQLGIAYKNAQALLGLADMMLRTSQHGKVKPLLEEADFFLKNETGRGMTEFRRKSLELWGHCYLQAGRADLAEEFRRRAFKLNDSLVSQEQRQLENSVKKLTIQQIKGFQQDLENKNLKLSQRESELQLTKQKARNTRLLTTIVGMTAFSLIFFLIMTIRRRSLNQKKQRELLEVKNQLSEMELKNQELESNRLRNELDMRKKDLSDLAIYLSNLRDLNDNVVQELHQMKNLEPIQQKERIRDIVMNLSNRIQVDHKTGLIQENISQVNQEFYSKLNDTFPKLTKSESELCGLLRLNLSNKEIAALKNVTPASVKMGRYRLRKKLGLSPDENIYAFLQKL